MSAIKVIPSAVLFRGAKLIALAAALYVILRFIGFHKLFTDDAEGIGALLQVIGTLYSVVYAFATYVIWGQFAAVENEIVKESGALKDLVLFSKALKETTRDPIVRAVRGYAHVVAQSEWEILSHRESTERTDRLFQGIIASVTDAKTEDDSERRVHERLLDIANQASAHREERLAMSSKRMPRTLLLFVTMTALTIIFLLFLYPFHNLALGAIFIAIPTSLLFFAHFVLTDLDNPFEGTWNVDAQAFRELDARSR